MYLGKLMLRESRRGCCLWYLEQPYFTSCDEVLLRESFPKNAIYMKDGAYADPHCWYPVLTLTLFSTITMSVAQHSTVLHKYRFAHWRRVLKFYFLTDAQGALCL